MSKRKQDGAHSSEKRAKGDSCEENPKGSTFVVTVVNDSIQAMQEWTEEETARLKQAVEVDGGQFNWDMIASAVPSKDINQVKTYVSSMLQPAENQNNQPASIIKAPIEIWTDLAQKLTSDEDKAAAVCLPQLMVAAAAEPVNAQESGNPNYSQIYLYLSRLLRGESPDVLPPLESSVVLSLIQEIVNKIRTSDLSGQMHYLANSYKSFQFSGAGADENSSSETPNSERLDRRKKKANSSPSKSPESTTRRTSSGRLVRQRVQLVLDSDDEENEEDEMSDQEKDTQPVPKPRPTSLNPFRIPVHLLNFRPAQNRFSTSDR